MRAACLSFPAATGLGADNISPRALARLSDPTLARLAALLHAAERLGQWPPSMRLVSIVLLPKPDGGRRPIGLFPTIVRVWMRCRLHVARKWEEDHALPALYGGPGMGAQRAAWTAMFAAESAAAGGDDHAAALLDLTKCFERLPHHAIVREARRLGYNLMLLRLSLDAYRMRRVIGIDGRYSDYVTACRGITAGSGFATTELRVLLFTMISVVCRYWTTAQIMVYVDDITITSSGPPPLPPPAPSPLPPTSA